MVDESAMTETSWVLLAIVASGEFYTICPSTCYGVFTPAAERD
jgi:hypothetical protein